uniref:GATA-type domain-containing protein n=1 Tax=Mycena chlorophos TaxID=658473 RepID=A0ABQ0LMU6_MYCCL|nr:predicted protein [Mycena chlorophos]
MYPHFDTAVQLPLNEEERDYPQVAQFTFDVCAPFEYLQVAEYQTSPQYFWSSAQVPGNAPRPSLKVLSPSATPETIYQSQDFALDFSELSPLPGLADLRSLGYPLGAGHYDKGLSLEFDLEFPHDAFGPYPALPSPPSFSHVAEVEEDSKLNILPPPSPSQSLVPRRLTRPPHFVQCPSCKRPASECGQARSGCVSGKMVCSRCGQYEKRTQRTRPIGEKVRLANAAVSARAGTRAKARALGG